MRFGRGRELTECLDHGGELLVMSADAGLEFIKLGREGFLCAEPLPQTDERADDVYSHLDCRIAV